MTQNTQSCQTLTRELDFSSFPGRGQSSHDENWSWTAYVDSHREVLLSTQMSCTTRCPGRFRTRLGIQGEQESKRTLRSSAMSLRRNELQQTRGSRTRLLSQPRPTLFHHKSLRSVRELSRIFSSPFCKKGERGTSKGRTSSRPL